MAASSSTSGKHSSSSNSICRIIIQQCTNAQLSFDTEDPSVSIRRGMVVYVCFLQGATENSIEAIARTILEAKLCEPAPIENNGSTSPNTRRVSPFDFISTTLSTTTLENNDDSDTSKIHNVYDILLIPQATLCGKLKGKSMQYHGLIDKTEGLQLFMKLFDTIRLKQTEKNQECIVHHGVYGARQILKMETNGPFTHMFDF